jgi:hypothetical protein
LSARSANLGERVVEPVELLQPSAGQKGKIQHAGEQIGEAAEGAVLEGRLRHTTCGTSLVARTCSTAALLAKRGTP